MIRHERFAIVRALLLVPFLAGSSTAVAASWTVFAECGDPGQERLFSYDPSLVSSNGHRATVPVQVDYSRVNGSRTQTAKLTWALDCSRRKLVERARTEYDGSGTVVARRKKPTGSMAFNAGSVADKLFDKVCS